MKFKIVKCMEPDDWNFGGWDVLVQLPDASYTCVAEVFSFDKVVSLFNDRENARRPTVQRLIDIVYEGFDSLPCSC